MDNIPDSFFTALSSADAPPAGMLQEEVGVLLLGGALILSAGAGALAAGVPLLLLPAPLIGAAYLALYYRSGLLRDYLLFVGCTLITCAWFLYHHFWFLEVRCPGPRSLSLPLSPPGPAVGLGLPLGCNSVLSTCSLRLRGLVVWGE